MRSTISSLIGLALSVVVLGVLMRVGVFLFNIGYTFGGLA